MDSVSQALAQLGRARRLRSLASRSSASPRAPYTEPLADFIARVAPRHAPLPWHLARLVALFERALTERVYAIVSMPPRHAKTTTVRRALAWALKKFPDRLNALGMYAESSAHHQSRQVRKLARAEGIALEPDAQGVGLWLTPEGGGLFAAGAFGQWTGKGVDGLLVLDDIVKGREAAESPAIRDKVWDTLTDDVLTRLEPPGGSVVVVMTRWHEDDPAGRLIERAGADDFPPFEVINLPALRDPATGEPSDAQDAVALWPERFPRADLVTKRALLGPYGWSSLFQGRPRPKSGRVFSGDPARYVAPALDGARLSLFVDGAGTEGTHSDFTAAVALALTGSGAAMTGDVLEVWQDRLVPERSARELRAFQRRHGGGRLRIENTRDGKAIARQLLLIEPDLAVELVTPVGDKFARAQPVAAAWNQARVRVPLHAPWLKDFLHQVGRFSVGSARDDMVDALSGAWNAAALDRGPVADAPDVPDEDRWAGHAGRGF